MKRTPRVYLRSARRGVVDALHPAALPFSALKPLLSFATLPLADQGRRKFDEVHREIIEFSSASHKLIA